MKKKILALAYCASFVFVLGMLRTVICPARPENDGDQPSGFQTSSALSFISGSASLIEPCGPGSGRGRGPSSTVQVANLGGKL